MPLSISLKRGEQVAVLTDPRHPDEEIVLAVGESSPTKNITLSIDAPRHIEIERAVDERENSVH